MNEANRFWFDKYKATFCKEDNVFNYHFNDCIERKKEINFAKLQKLFLELFIFVWLKLYSKFMRY